MIYPGGCAGLSVPLLQELLMFTLPSRFALAFAVVAGPVAAANANLILNGDFEAAQGDPLAPTAWRTNNAANTGFNYLTTGGPAGAGDAYVQIHGQGNPGSNGARWISNRVDITPEQTYTIDLDYLGQSNSFYVRIDFFEGGAFKSGVELYDLKNGSLPTFTQAAEWTHKRYEFTAPAGANQIEVVLRKNDWGATGNVDNVVVSPLPEPATVGALVTGLTLTGLRRR